MNSKLYFLFKFEVGHILFLQLLSIHIHTMVNLIISLHIPHLILRYLKVDWERKIIPKISFSPPLQSVQNF